MLNHIISNFIKMLLGKDSVNNKSPSSAPKQNLNKNNINAVSHDLASFQNIKNIGSFDIDFTQSNEEQSIVVTAEQHVHECISLEVTANTLIIESKSSFSTNKPINIKIFAPFIKDVYVMGSGNVNLNNIANEQLYLNIQGSGDISANGLTSSSTFKVIGSGSINCKNLNSIKSKNEILGSGSIKSHVTSIVKNINNGSGSIKIFGNPQIRENSNNGSGSIKFSN